MRSVLVRAVAVLPTPDGSLVFSTVDVRAQCALALKFMLRITTILWHGLAVVAWLALSFATPYSTDTLLPDGMQLSPTEKVASVPFALMVNGLLVGAVWLVGWIFLLLLRAIAGTHRKRQSRW